jgi:hypothetical protein
MDIGTAPQRHAPSASAQVSELLEHFVCWINSGFFPFIDVRVQLLAAEPLDGPAQLLVFVREQHRLISGVRGGRRRS